MPAFYYAQLDESGTCIAVSALSGEVNAKHMIRLTEGEYLKHLLGWRYENGAWTTPPSGQDATIDGLPS